MIWYCIRCEFIARDSFEAYAHTEIRGHTFTHDRKNTMSLFQKVMLSVDSTGGATIALHGAAPTMMGDKYDYDVWVIGGATDRNDIVVPTDVIHPQFFTESLFNEMVRAMKYRARPMYQAMGIWKNPDSGYLEIDLVDTANLKTLALLWASERNETAIYNLVSHELVYVNPVNSNDVASTGA